MAGVMKVAVKRPILVAVLFAICCVVAQLLMAALLSPAWRSLDSSLSQILSFLASEQKPTSQDAAILVKQLLVSLIPTLGVALLVLVGGIIIGSSIARYMCRERTGVVARRAGFRPWSISGISVALLVVVVSGLLVFMVVPVQRVAVRGSLLTVLMPGAPHIVAALALCTVGFSLLPLLKSCPPTLCNFRDSLTSVKLSLRWGGVAALLSIAAALLSLLIVAQAFAARPIGDDLRFFSAIRDANLVEFLHGHLTRESGRYTQGAMLWLLFRVAGESAVQLAPLIYLVALSIALATAVRAFLPGAAALPRLFSAAIGWFVAAVTLSSVPSVSDSVLWISASTVYIPPLIFLPVAAVFLRRALLAATKSHTLLFTLLASAAMFSSQGTFELTALLSCLALGVLLLVQLCSLRSRYLRGRFGVVAMMFAASLVGLMILLFSPGQTTRVADVGGGKVVLGVLGAVYGQTQLWQLANLPFWVFVLCGGLALAVPLSLAASDKVLRGLLLAWAVFGVLVPAANGFVAFYALGWAPWRVYTDASAAFLWAWMLLFAAAFTVLARWVNGSANKGLPIGSVRFFGSNRRVVPINLGNLAGVITTVLGLMLAGGYALLLPQQLQLLHAEQLRAALLAQRDRQVVQQVESGDATITVLPAPLLYYPADARDFEYSQVQSKDWFESGFRQWFGIVPQHQLVYVLHPPAWYCTKDSTVLQLHPAAECARARSAAADARAW